MSKKLILYIALLLKINLSISKEEFDFFDKDDYEKCISLNKEAILSTSSNKCSSINSSLKLKEDRCCKLTINIDVLQQLKNNFPENWRIKYSQLYGFDENLSEDEIREKYVKNRKESACILMTGDEEFRNFILHDSSKLSINGKINYDCGDGEKIYKTKEYIPKQHKFKILYDSRECIGKTNETDCHNSASKFLTDDVLACWNTINYYDKKNIGFSAEERCIAYSAKEYKSEFTRKFKNYKLLRNIIEETWKCVDRNGKRIQIYMNTKTGKIKFS